MTRELALYPSHLSKQAGGIKRQNAIKLTDDNAPRTLSPIYTHARTYTPSQEPETQPMTEDPLQAAPTQANQTS